MFSRPFLLELSLLGLNHKQKKKEMEAAAKYQHSLKTVQLLESLGQTIDKKGESAQINKGLKSIGYVSWWCHEQVWGVRKHQSTFSNSLFHSEKFTFLFTSSLLKPQQKFPHKLAASCTNKTKDKGCTHHVLMHICLNICNLCILQIP